MLVVLLVFLRAYRLLGRSCGRRRHIVLLILGWRRRWRRRCILRGWSCRRLPGWLTGNWSCRRSLNKLPLDRGLLCLHTLLLLLSHRLGLLVRGNMLIRNENRLACKVFRKRLSGHRHRNRLLLLCCRLLCKRSFYLWWNLHVCASFQLERLSLWHCHKKKPLFFIIRFKTRWIKGLSGKT